MMITDPDAVWRGQTTSVSVHPFFFQGASVYQTHTETTLHATSVAKGRIHAVRNAA